jgi:peptidoglycan/xylan/chitin deacetylase (PgdA/CDA1 family)
MKIYAFVFFMIMPQAIWAPACFMNQVTDTASNLPFPPIKYTAHTGTKITVKQVPVLCYHHVKASTAGKSLDYTISLDAFRAHIKMLSDSGYHTILPEQLYENLSQKAPLPSRPIIISFDDAHEEHFSMVRPVMDSAGFKGVFFTMGVTIGKQHYLTAAQLKQLTDSGHAIGCHTWDHPDLRKLTGKDWDWQVSKPKQLLEKITGKPVLSFAYPFGAWNQAAIAELRKRGIQIAFQLSDRASEEAPIHTIRRLMVAGNWSPAKLYKRIQATFH